MRRTPIASLFALTAALAVPAGALATIIEVGQVPRAATPGEAIAVPSCPGNPCLAVSRTTGYQAQTGLAHQPFKVAADGRIVAWSISLGKPTAKQVSFFDTNEGGLASAAVAVLRGGRSLDYSLVAQSPLQMLAPFFGQTVQFPLTTTIAVKKGDVIALTVPTWAPALGLGFNNNSSWRASRARRQCSNTTAQTAQSTLSSTLQYFCLYRTARLTYSATVVTNPVGAVLTPTKTTKTTTTTTSTSRTRTTTRHH